jgi:hypothetical protein
MAVGQGGLEGDEVCGETTREKLSSVVTVGESQA